MLRNISQYARRQTLVRPVEHERTNTHTIMLIWPFIMCAVLNELKRAVRKLDTIDSASDSRHVCQRQILKGQ